MTKTILLACTLLFSMAFCCGIIGDLPFLAGRPADEAPPDTTQATTIPTATPTASTNAAATAAVEPTQSPDAPLVPGLDPELVLAHFGEDDRMLCRNWDHFWNVWEGSCYTPAPPYPAYVITVYSRTPDTVDNIQAGVYLQDEPDLAVVMAFFEEVLNLPYQGADPEPILAWLADELTGADLHQFIYEETTHNGIPYTLSGTITFGIDLDIGLIEPFIELP